MRLSHCYRATVLRRALLLGWMHLLGGWQESCGLLVPPGSGGGRDYVCRDSDGTHWKGGQAGMVCSHPQNHSCCTEFVKPGSNGSCAPGKPRASTLPLLLDAVDGR